MLQTKVAENTETHLVPVPLYFKYYDFLRQLNREGSAVELLHCAFIL
jgi:hypothetical protein